MRPTFLLHIISAIMTFFQEALLLKGDPAMRSQAPAGADECAAYEKEKAMGEWQVEREPCSEADSILQRVYTREHTIACRSQDKKLVMKCRHCFACRGFPAPPPQAGSLKEKVLGMVTRAPPPVAVPPPHQGPPINVRRGPVPTSRWRQDESLGEARNSMLERRARAQLSTLKLPLRYTNIASLRISAPSDMCMEKYSFVASSSRRGATRSRQEPQVVHAKEIICQHGKYLQTVCEEVPQSRLASAGLQKSKSKSKSSPQSVLAGLGTSGTPSRSSSGSFEGGAQEAKEPRHKKKRKSGMEMLSSFLQGCILVSGDDLMCAGTT